MRTKDGYEGMQSLPIAPFPFLNPWNWGAMTPVNGVQAALLIARANLSAWRCMWDACQSTLRHQEDAALDALGHALKDPNVRPEPKRLSSGRTH